MPERLGNALLRVIMGFLLGVLPIKYAWDWTVPSLAPGAVGEGLVVGMLPWLSAFKLTISLAVLTMIASVIHAGRNTPIGVILGQSNDAARQERNHLNPEPRTPNPQ